MPILSRLAAIVVLLPFFLSGCQERAAAPQAASTTTSTDADEEAQIRQNLAQLSPEDRKLAQAQKFCAIEGDNRLGAMGKPVKIVMAGEPVFLCCKGCSQDAQKHPAQTLARVRELRKKHGSPFVGM